jgi:hypothetical protein
VHLASLLVGLQAIYIHALRKLNGVCWKSYVVKIQQTTAFAVADWTQFVYRNPSRPQPTAFAPCGRRMGRRKIEKSG